MSRSLRILACPAPAAHPGRPALITSLLPELLQKGFEVGICNFQGEIRAYTEDERQSPSGTSLPNRLPPPLRSAERGDIDHDLPSKNALDPFRPDALVFEHYPFQPSWMETKWRTLLGEIRAAHSQLLIATLLPDVLPSQSDDCLLSATQDFLDLFDRGLVFGDPSVLPLEASFPLFNMAHEKLIYTGYLGPVLPYPGPRNIAASPAQPVLVLADGHTELAAIALEARRFSRHYRLAPWLMVTGEVPDITFQHLAQRAAKDPRLTVGRAFSELGKTLEDCAVIIAAGHYDRVTEMLASGIPSILFPQDPYGEKEESIRCGALAAAGYVRYLPRRDASGSGLADLLDAISEDGSKPAIFKQDGAASAAALIERMILSAFPL